MLPDAWYDAHLISLGKAFMKLAAAQPEPSTTTRGLSSLTASCTDDMAGMSVYTGMDSTACCTAAHRADGQQPQRH